MNVGNVPLLTIEDISLAESIFLTITVPSGKRKGSLYKSSKLKWRNDKDGRMALTYHVWRTLAFRIGQDIKLPLYSRKYMMNDDDKEQASVIIDYIGFKYFREEYSMYATTGITRI